MFCNKCGKEISDSAQFCNYCGNTIKAGDNSQNKNISVCFKCAGIGAVRSTIKMIISVLIVLIIFTAQMDLIGMTGLFLDGGSGIVVFLVLAIFDAGILYWGFNKKMCPVCHGRGKVDL